MLELMNLTAGYGRRTVLDGVSAAFPRGSLTAVVGVNGSGKSTLLKAALGLIPRRGGIVSADGVDLSTLSRGEIARRVAYLSQGRDTPDMTVGQLVLHGRFPYLSYPRRYRPEDRAAAAAALERVGLSALAGAPLSTLSGGMRQTAYLALALAQETDYVLLDEPATYLDISHQLALMDLLRSLAEEGKGVVAVTHDLPLAFERADRILLLDGGRVALEGTPAEVAASPILRDCFGVGLRLTEENRYLYV